MSGPESRNNAADVSNKEEIKCLFTRVYIPGDEGAKKKKKREREKKRVDEQSFDRAENP